MEYATLRLSKKDDHGNYFDLKFKLLKNKFVPKWVDRVLEAQQNQYPISEPWAMYNLNSSFNGNFLKDNLNRLIKEVDCVHELFGFSIGDINDQNTLNKIHAIFEDNHGKLDEWKANPLFNNKPDSFRKNLSEINQFVHACESFNGSPKIRIVWFDLPKHKKFTDEDYSLFTNKRSFGSLYHLYADVGKNIESLAEDNDSHHHDVVPNLHYGADCVVYFCSDSDIEVENLKTTYNKYIEKNKNYLESKGYNADSKKLTTGRIEMARLETEMSETEILEKIKNFDVIHSLKIS